MSAQRERPPDTTSGSRRRPAGPKARPMDNVDVAWLRMDHPANLMMVTALLLFERPLDPDRVASVLRRRLLPFDRFRQRVVERGWVRSRPRWEPDPRFDLSSHLRRVALPEPGDDAALRELVGALMSTPLDPSKPLWMVHLIENHGEGCGVLIRIHHCVADGMALLRVLMTLTDRGPRALRRSAARTRSRHREAVDATPPAGPAARVRRSLAVAGRILREDIRAFARPARTLELARRGVDGAAAVGHLLLRPSDSETAFRGTLGVPKTPAWSGPLPLEQVKAIGRATGSTVNDVLVAAVAGALRRYLQERGEPVADLRFHAAVPVNLRPPEETPSLGNRFGLVFLRLPLSIDDPLERLFEVRKRMKELKQSAEAGVALSILDTLGMTSAEIERSLIRYLAAKASCVITNVAGPGKPVRLAGQPVRTVLFWVPQAGRVSLGVSILSYSGEVRLGVVTDRGLVPDPETIVDAFHREFDALSELLREPQREATAV